MKKNTEKTRRQGEDPERHFSRVAKNRHLDLNEVLGKALGHTDTEVSRLDERSGRAFRGRISESKSDEL